MGVSGSGKSTIGSTLAIELGWKFYDADDFHSAENRRKMEGGTPLTEGDREPWLKLLRNLIEENIARAESCVLACSALKKSHREILKAVNDVQFIYLKGSYDLIASRIKNRLGHYMPVELLQSQLEVLEEPANGFVVDINHSPTEIVQFICKGLDL